MGVQGEDRRDCWAVFLVRDARPINSSTIVRDVTHGGEAEKQANQGLTLGPGTTNFATRTGQRRQWESSCPAVQMI